MTLITAVLMIAFLVGIFVAGMWVGTEMFEAMGLGWMTPPKQIVYLRAAPPGTEPGAQPTSLKQAARPVTRRQQIAMAVQDVTSEALPTSPAERRSAARKKIVFAVVGALVYFISPIDVVPDFFLGVGQMDDLAIAVTALCTVVDNWGIAFS